MFACFVFSLTLVEIGTMTNACLAGIKAAHIELLFDDLADDDIRRIRCLASGAFDTVAGVPRSRTGNARSRSSPTSRACRGTTGRNSRPGWRG